jgi:hypothetical protein
MTTMYDRICRLEEELRALKASALASDERNMEYLRQELKLARQKVTDLINRNEQLTKQVTALQNDNQALSDGMRVLKEMNESQLGYLHQREEALGRACLVEEELERVRKDLLIVKQANEDLRTRNENQGRMLTKFRDIIETVQEAVED